MERESFQVPNVTGLLYVTHSSHHNSNRARDKVVVVTDSIFDIRSLHVLYAVAGKACVCDMPGRLEGGGGGPTLMDPYRRLQRSSHRRTQVKSLPSKVPALAACCL